MKGSDISASIRPIDKTVSKTVYIAVGIIAIAIGAAAFSSFLILQDHSLTDSIWGIALVWVGSVLFFYGTITEEHMMKEIFIRQGYFFTGLIAMILGIMFISIAGLSRPLEGSANLEFGVLLEIAGGALVILSAQKTRDYSGRSGLFALVSGTLLMIGGIVSSSVNVSYAGVFIMIFAGFWLGLRDKYAQ